MDAMRFWATRNKNFSINIDGLTNEGPVCYQYAIDNARIDTLNLVISLSTVVINLVVKIVAVYLISLIRIDTESLQASFITILVFLSYYFNTGWLIILADANMKG